VLRLCSVEKVVYPEPHGIDVEPAFVDLCPRRGQYRKDTLIARFGGGVLMPDVWHLIAECPREDAPGAACGVYFADLRRSE
jgi:hypothetical protein